jgi:hypothetical protein
MTEERQSHEDLLNPLSTSGLNSRRAEGDGSKPDGSEIIAKIICGAIKSSRVLFQFN